MPAVTVRPPRTRALLVSLVLVAAFQGLAAGQAGPSRAQQTPASRPAAAPGALDRLAASFPAPAPAYYLPVIRAGRAFPVARSNYLSLLWFPNNWHAPRMRLINGVWRLVGVHLGIDIVAERGTPIFAMEPGVVENVGWTFYSGTRIGVRGADARYYLYAHLSTVEPGIGPGARVAAGSVLGRVGNTGYGPPGHRDEFPAHLHLGIQSARGEWVNPYPLLVRLYDAAVVETTKAQTALDRLAAAGKREAWKRGISRAYSNLIPPGGE